MLNTKEESLRFLNEAKAAVLNISSIKNLSEEKNDQLKKLQRELENDQKSLSDEIDSTIRKRRNEIMKPYESKASDLQSKIKKEQSKREKAKSVSMKTRIQNETAQLSQEQQELNNRIKMISSRNGVPSYCNTGVFDLLSRPSGFKQILAMLAVFAVCFVVIPVLGYLIWGRSPEVLDATGAVVSGGSNTFLLILSFVICFVVFGALYYFFILRVKLTHRDELKEIGLLRDQKLLKQISIDKIADSIKNDRDETMYNLGSFDATIASLNTEYQQAEADRAAAEDKFVNETQNEISSRIMEARSAKLEELRANIGSLSREVEDISGQLRRVSADYSEKYESVLGSDFTKPVIIDRLAGYIMSGQAANLAQSQELYRAGTKLVTHGENQ